MTSSPRIVIVIPSAADDDGILRCFEHALEARKERNRNCKHSKGSRCLRCEYYVCPKDSDDPERCGFFWWAGEPVQQPQRPLTPPPSQADMSTYRPSQKLRAANARSASASVSPQKRNRSNSPPLSDQNPPTTPAAKRFASNQDGQAGRASKTPMSKSTPLTPAQRAIRDKHIADGVEAAEALKTSQTPDITSPKSHPRSNADHSVRNQAIADALREGMGIEGDRSLFSPPPSHSRLPGIQQQLLEAHSEKASGAPRPSDGRSLNAKASGKEIISEDEEQDLFWSSQGTSSHLQQNATAGPSNARRSAASNSIRELDEHEEDQRRPSTPRASGRTGNTGSRVNYIPTPPDSSSLAEEERERSPSSATQISDYLQPDPDVEEPPEEQAHPFSTTTKGKQRESTAQSRSQRVRGTHDAENPFIERQTTASQSHSQFTAPQSGAQALIDHASSLSGIADYVRQLEQEREDSRLMIQQQSGKIADLETEIQRLQRKIQRLERSRHD